MSEVATKTVRTRMARLGRLRLRGKRREEDGFVLVYVALCMTVLLGMAAFGVDIGAWYLRAEKIQRTADAAAMAGVVYMPGDLTQATQVADGVAESNGFDVNEVSVAAVANEPHELLVTIKDPNVPSYFARAFGINSIHETRTGVAEYQPSIPLGSPENSFGTGNLALGTGNPTNIWAAVNGYCTSKENGDEFLSEFDASYNNGWVCGAAPTSPHGVNNEEYATHVAQDGTTQPVGYYYDIDIPPSTSLETGQPLTIQAYDPSYEPSCSSSPDDPLAGNQTITTNYALSYAPAPLDPSSDVPMGIYTANSGDAGTCAQWVTIGTVANPPAGGEYKVEVYTKYQEPNSDGTNAYGLRVYQGGGPWTRCSTITTIDCPQIHGETALSVYANQGGGTATFDLASVDAAYAGHTMKVTLFDPGEGSNDLKILDPSGTATNFTYQTIDPNPCSPDCDSQVGFTPYSGGPTNDLVVSGQITPPAGESSHSQYNDRHVQLTIQIPSNYTAPNGGWWSIQYNATGTVTDRTTWSVALLGTPIHLVQ
jgi:hypothetical protein